ncbi:MAG: PilT/PilU family type 4a pilus ATPase [Gallionella sp.]|nr:PilT/PilU family type 4a pilus ATPase [Gallionella sp.]
MIVTPLLQMAVEREASDIFFSVGAPVNIKIHGIVMPVNAQKLDPELVKKIAYELMGPKRIAEFESDMEMNFSMRAQDIGNFRVNVFKQRGSISIVIRCVKTHVLSSAELNLPNIVNELIMEKRGLVMVVGSTGSGKSTTLASMIQYRNTEHSGHILTIEDPLEYLFRHDKCVINQREVGTDTRSYEEALINGMREAPDVLMIGEIRDKETLRHALIFAQTGHLCLTTLHANNSYHALNRIVNFFPYDARVGVLADLSMCLRAVISQRLVRTGDGKQMPVVEILLNTSLIADMIKNDEVDKIKNAIEQSVSAGSQTFEQALYKLFKAGKITKDEAMRNADSASNLAALIDFSERTSKSPVFDPDKVGVQSESTDSDIGHIKLHFDTSK